MCLSTNSIVLILGGAGAQNIAVAKVLSAAGTYTIHVLTRSVRDNQKELGSLSNVKLIEGDSYDEDTLVSAFKGVNMALVNTMALRLARKMRYFGGFECMRLLAGLVWNTSSTVGCAM
jgi:nucleoside-diphosphate-sugar epimerase